MELNYEKKLWNEGYKTVIGVDEAGRGSIAGPVTAAAIRVSPRFQIAGLLEEVNDSKLLTARKREDLYQVLTGCPEVVWAVSWVTSSVIDRINILEATKRAMARAVRKVSKGGSGRKGMVLVDGRVPFKTKLEQVFIKRGDRRVFSCAAASIIAKVFRDRTMTRYRNQWPDYRFDRHKGYPTELHRKTLRRCGPTRIHRRTFRPVRHLDF